MAKRCETEDDEDPPLSDPVVDDDNDEGSSSVPLWVDVVTDGVVDVDVVVVDAMTV
jgi:hypothetical protein